MKRLIYCSSVLIISACGGGSGAGEMVDLGTEVIQPSPMPTLVAVDPTEPPTQMQPEDQNDDADFDQPPLLSDGPIPTPHPLPEGQTGRLAQCVGDFENVPGRRRESTTKLEVFGDFSFSRTSESDTLEIGETIFNGMEAFETSTVSRTVESDIFSINVGDSITTNSYTRRIDGGEAFQLLGVMISSSNTFDNVTRNSTANIIYNPPVEFSLNRRPVGEVFCQEYQAFTVQTDESGESSSVQDLGNCGVLLGTIMVETPFGKFDTCVHKSFMENDAENADYIFSIDGFVLRTEGVRGSVLTSRTITTEAFIDGRPLLGIQ